jgi:hypothetical protein
MMLPRWLTGGRPMNRICYCFEDAICRQPVYFWRDRYGRPWLAHHAWSLFRVEPAHDERIWE